MVSISTFAILIVCFSSALAAIDVVVDRVPKFVNSTPSEGGLELNSDLDLFIRPRHLSSKLKSQPLPTNKWWSNLILTDPFELNYATFPVYSNPYRINVETYESPYGLRSTLPSALRHFIKGSDGELQGYTHLLGKFYHLGFSAAEFTSRPRFSVEDFDDFGVQMSLQSTSGSMKSTLVSGMAFITTTYHNLTPSITSFYEIHKINDQADGTVTGTKFIISLTYNKLQWVIYSDQKIALQFSKDRKSVVAARPYNGVLRMAILPQNANNKIYDNYASCIVQGADLRIENEFQYGLDWKTTGDCKNGLLHLALPNQIQSLDLKEAEKIDLQLESPTRGIMQGIITTSADTIWKFNEPEEIDIGLLPPNPASKEMIEKYGIYQYLKQEIEDKWDKGSNGLYFAGKSALKYANLCLLAGQENLRRPQGKLLRRCLRKLEDYFTRFVDNSWEHPMVYDEVYGGLVSSEGIKAAKMNGVKDLNRDFGNSFYNDHHYHYGYWLVASSILKKLDPTWSRMEDLDRIVSFVIRDTANANGKDDYFPRFRYFDWYTGHSYSKGAMATKDGKDEESVSEEMNFHYGLMLWGQVSKFSKLEEMGRLMMKVNKRAIQTYFLFGDDNEIHPSSYVGKKVAGVFYDNKVEYSTWFGGEKWHIHGIQMLPVSPVNSFFRSDEFVREEWDNILSHTSIAKQKVLSVEDGEWASLIFANVARVDPEYGLQKLESIRQMDNGLSRSWALYYAASQVVSSSSTASINSWAVCVSILVIVSLLKE